MRFLLLATVLLCCTVHAVADKYTKCAYQYFKGGKVATSTCYDADGRWGKARAYTRDGKMLYERELRRVGGSSSVEFTYYSSGAVKQAHWHSAPDGGIQWYNTTNYFSEDGKITSETENNYDSHPGTTWQPQTREKPLRSDTTAPPGCAVIYSSEFWFINATAATAIVTVKRGTEETALVIKKGATVKGGQLILAQQFEDPGKYYTFDCIGFDVHDKTKMSVRQASRAPEQVSKEVRRYYFELTPGR
jgi:hypothetical protein